MDHTSRLKAYLATVEVLGAGAVALLLTRGHLTVGPGHVLACALLGALLVIAELFPIQVPRGGNATDEVTLSHTFGLGLLFVAPPWVAVGAQVVALVVDTVVHRRDWRKQPFNAAMFTASYAAAWATYATLAPGADLGHVRPLPAALAGLVFLVVNNLLMAGLLSIGAGRTVFAQFVSDVRWMAIFNVPAAALGSVVAICALLSPWLLLFVLTPLVAVHRSGMTASRREHEALHDQLTGLGNRTLITSVLDSALQPDRPGRHAVLLVDLDHFKDINDTLGHHVGDALLVTAAEVLSGLVPVGGVVARLGGDEFAIFVRDTDAPSAVELAEQIVLGLRQPRQIEGMSLRVRGSVGIAMFPDDALTRTEVLRRADVALYKAKETRDRYVSYRPEQDRTALDQLTLANELAALLEDTRNRDQLFLTYQPLVTTADSSLCGVECLIRWAHPRLGLLMPEVFLPLAEHAGLTGSVGRHVLELAVAQQRRWANEGLDLRVSVNVSVPELSDTDFPEVVATLLARHGVRPDRLVIEVTENSLISDPQRSSEILRRIRATGARVSIDDYGSGYSSLAYVKQLEVDELKIDRQFAAGVRDDVTDRIIVQSTIDLAHQLQLRVVAEGIEDVATAAILRDMGCDVLQGFALGRPGSAADITSYAPVELPVRAHGIPGGLRVVQSGSA